MHFDVSYIKKLNPEPLQTLIGIPAWGATSRQEDSQTNLDWFWETAMSAIRKGSLATPEHENETG